MNNQKNRKNLLIIISEVIVIILLVLVIIIIKHNLKGNAKENNIYIYKRMYNSTYWLTGETKEEIIYYFYNNLDEFDPGENVDQFEMIGEYKCVSSNCKAYDYSKYLDKVIINDNGYKLYNPFTKKIENISLGEETYSFINFIEDDNKVYGLSVGKEDKKVAFYNFELAKYINNFDYSRIYMLNSLINKGYIFAEKDRDTYILNYLTGEVIKTMEKYKYFTELKVGNYYLYIAKISPEYNYRLFDSNFNLIIDDDRNYKYALNSDGTVTIVYSNENKYNIYNMNGEIISTSNEYKEIVKVVKDYIMILDDNNDLKVLDLQGNELVTLLNVIDSYELHPEYSGWGTYDDKTGIYIALNDYSVLNGTLGRGLEYFYIPSTKETFGIRTEGIVNYAKPILYLYPTRKTEVTVSFERPYLLTTTYPKFATNWQVTAYENGDLYDFKGNYYYGLYWEEKGFTDIDFSTGFYVTKESAIDFLEEKLSIIGLNNRERNEFIMYWLPILEKNGQSLVYFELTEERENYNKLIISPKPDSLLRVAIHVKKVESPVKINKQELPTFKRKGFTAVEWGGVVHN